MAKPYLLQELENKEQKVFHAVYNETTYEELSAAYNSGKLLFLNTNNEIESNVELPLIQKSIDGRFYFGYRHSPNYVTGIIYYFCYLNNNNETEWDDELAEDLQGFKTVEPCSSVSVNIPLSSQIAYFRPILVSDSEPKSSEGMIGDIWIKYST